MSPWQALEAGLLEGQVLSPQQALSLAECHDTARLAAVAGALRDRGFHNVVTYSRKVFIPLTHLCRDVCHYCTFARTPKKIDRPFMGVEQVLELCHQGARLGCQEALFTLGEKPELRYSAARNALEALGFADTLSYLRHVASRVLEETGLLPHINAGCMTSAEIAGLRQVSASMGIMLESASTRLCEKGMPHYGSPDKNPAVRLQTLELAGRAAVPFTSGILIGIGETRRERIESLLALREVHERHGHLQEVIVQNFRAKPGTLMAAAPEPDLDDLLWTIAVARLIFGPVMSIQAPPNLSPGVLPQLVAAGINDWGGVSPLTPDHVNPEAPWPHLEQLARETAAAGKFLDQRLTIYPAYASAPRRWLDPALRTAVLRLSDADGFARRDSWVPGEERPIPSLEAGLLRSDPPLLAVSEDIRAIVERCRETADLSETEITRLFQARGNDFAWLVRQADELRRQVNGDSVSFVVNRNINYTNVCYFKCQFCAFSKGKHSEDLRGLPYDISGEEIAGRCTEAWQRGATEVCMQGGIHPDYTGQTYLDILHTVRAASPGMHVHAFSPLEVAQGAATLGIGIESFLQRLKAAGLNTLPGTAAEVLHDEVRQVLCPDKLNTARWLEVIEAAHRAGLPTTATIMYGHIDQPHHWARHLWQIRELQRRTGGFTEFVPLPFVHMEAPMYLRGKARPGPTFREALLMHSVARLVLHGLIDNIQASWVKMGEQGVAACLAAGVNDLGGTLMNESITRAAGAGHGQEWAPAYMEQQITAAGRQPRMRTTLYRDVPRERRDAAFGAEPLSVVDNAPAGKRQRSKRLVPVATVLQGPGPLDRFNPVYEQVMLMAACN
jgi:FO synthase